MLKVLERVGGQQMKIKFWEMVGCQQMGSKGCCTKTKQKKRESISWNLSKSVTILDDLEILENLYRSW